MADLDAFRVVPFAPDEYVPADASGPPLFTWREYYGFRNDVLRILKPHGTVGPMAEMPILDNWEASNAGWEGGDREPDFFVVDDMWNQYNRWNRIETAASLVSTQLLGELIGMLQKWPGWAIYLALTVGGLTVLEDRVLYEGEVFENSHSLNALGERCMRVDIASQKS